MSSPLHETPPDVPVAPRPLAELVAPLRTAGLLAGDIVGPADVAVSSVTMDSREAGPGVLFGAVRPDTLHGRDGHDFVDAAFEMGAAAALVSGEWLAAHGGGPSAPEPLGKGERLPGAALVPTTDTRAALAEVAAELYGRPGDQLALVGVTGTNGKTTTTFLIHHLLTALGVTAGLVGTIETRVGRDRYATEFTTPEAPALQRLLRAMVDAGCTHAAMETSSHGLALDRVRTLAFNVGVFTNLTHDHLDFHETAEAYEAAKKRLFDGLAANATAVVNRDDPAWERMVQDTAAQVVTVGVGRQADVRVEVLENTLDGLRLRLDGYDRLFRMAGRFNAFNLAAAYASARALGFGADETLDALADAPGVPGRFQALRSPRGVLAVVDYAHTPDALANVLQTAREIVAEGGRLWVVTGSGGDRDRTKRPEMAQAAETYADRVVVTQDNPRTEDPERIVADIRAGFERPEETVTIVDRGEAIRYAIHEAAPGDVVVIAGKGHETYQDVGGAKRPFDDRAVVHNAFATENPTGSEPTGGPTA